MVLAISAPAGAEEPDDPAADVAEEIVVVAPQQGAVRHQLDADELRQVPGSFGDPIRALQSLPGVARPSTLEGALAVRGAEGDHTATRIDGVTVPFGFHWFLGRSVVHPGLIDTVDFYPGGLPPRFGDALQAVVDVRTKRPNERRMGGTISADILDMAATGSADLGRTRITAAGRYSWVGGVVGLGSRLGAGGGDTWAHPRYVDTFLRVGHDVGPDTVEVTLLTARDALVVHHREGFDPPVIDGYDPDRLLDSWYGRLMTTWRRHGERPALTRLVFGPDLQSNQLTGAGVLGDGPENGSVRGWDVSLERIDELPLTPASWLEVGERVALRPVAVRDFKSLLGADSVADDRGLASGGAAWVELASKGPTEVGIGARVSIHGLGKRVWAFPEPRARLRTELAGPWSATWSGGRTSQLPRADQWSAALGDPSLSPATAWSTSLGFLGSWPSGLTFGATPYASVLSNVAIKETRVGIDPEPSPLGSHDLSSEPSYGAVKGRAAGVELLVRASGQERWFGWLALTLGRSWRIDGRTGFPADQDQPLALTALLSHGLGRGWRMSGRYRLTSGHPYTEQHAVFLATEDVWQGTPGPTNGERLSAFQQLDLRVDKRWSGRADWTLYLDVFNALNIRNALVATYNPNYTELVPVLSVPIVPSLGVEVAY